MPVAALELDLEVFSGPFDLLLTLVLREEVDLMEVEVADVVLAYLDHLEARGELDLDAATEFLVLVAALLELKSRLLLPGEDGPEAELEPEAAAEELLARLVEAQRFRRAAEHLAERLRAQEGLRMREAPLPAWLRRARADAPPQDGPRQDPARLAAALGALLRRPAPIDLSHVTAPTVSVGERLAHLRDLLRSGRVSFDAAVRGADRVTVAVTLYALLELHKRGEATWTQDEPFGPVTIAARGPAAEQRRRAS